MVESNKAKPANPPTISQQIDQMKLKNLEAGYEFVTRLGILLPALTSRFMTVDNLRKIADKKILCIMQNQVVFRRCYAPPRVAVLVQKIENYCRPLGIDTGFDKTKENYPDKEYLILCVATLSDGKDEIFDPAYSPPKLLLGADGQLAPVEKIDVDPIMQKVADAIVTGGGGRHMRFGTASKEDKLAQ